MGTNYNPSTNMDRLTLYFDGANVRSYSGTGVTWNDISGYNSSASTTGLTYVGTGVSSYFSFNGSFSGPVTGIGHLQYGTGPRTVMAWVRPSSTSGWLQVLGWGTATGNAASGLAISNAGKWATFQHNSAVYDGTTAVSNVWVHAAVTQSASGINLYINGASSATNVATVTTNEGAVYIGASFQNTEKWNGFISKVFFYNRVLSASEIKSYFDNTKILYGLGSAGSGGGGGGLQGPQ